MAHIYKNMLSHELTRLISLFSAVSVFSMKNTPFGVEIFHFHWNMGQKNYLKLQNPTSGKPALTDHGQTASKTAV